MENNSKNFQQDIKDKLPPQAIEAETSLLGGLMLDKNAIVKVVDLLFRATFIKKPTRILRSHTRAFERGEPVDLLSVSNRLRDKTCLKR